MNWIDLVWPLVAAICLTIGLIHLLIWFQRRNEYNYLLFGMASLFVSSIAVVELLAMRSIQAADYAALVRWGQVAYTFLIVTLALFLRHRFRAGYDWLFYSVCAVRIAALVPNSFAGESLNYASIASLRQVSIWGELVSAPVGEVNPWMLLGQLAWLLLLLYAISVVVTVLRRRDPVASRSVLLVGGGLIVFLLWNEAMFALAVLGVFDIPLIVSLSFAPVILIISYELGGEVLRSAHIAEQLAQSQSSFLESERRLRLAAQAGGLGLWTWDLEAGRSWVSATGYALLGMGPGESLGLDRMLSMVHPDDQQTVRSATDVAVAMGTYACEFRILQDGGKVRWLSAKGRVDHGSGQPRLMRGVLLDVTERRVAEERFRLVVEHAPHAILMVNARGRIALANEQAERLFGYSRVELMELGVDELVPQPSRFRHAADRASYVALPEVRAMGEGRKVFALRKDLHQVAVEIGLTPVRIAQEGFVIVSITDTSETQKLEHEAAQQRDELTRLSHAALLGEISGSLAHELNQPLTSVLSNAQAALRFLDHHPPNLVEIQDSLVHIVESDKRASEVIRRLRATLKQEVPDRHALRINDVVQDSLRLVSTDVLSRDASIIHDLHPKLPEIIGDSVQLKQVMLNLVINACDAMASSEYRLLTVMTYLSADGSVGVKVSDTGQGIADDQLDQVFTPFVTSKNEGIGLGLAICRTIIQAHGGRIWASSNAGGGASFQFELPVVTHA